LFSTAAVIATNLQFYPYFCNRGVMGLKTMKEQLKKWSKDNQHTKQPEKLTERDLRDLMNTNMKTLKRGKGGAFK
jgi:hypothetical protein